MGAGFDIPTVDADHIVGFDTILMTTIFKNRVHQSTIFDDDPPWPRL